MSEREALGGELSRNPTFDEIFADIRRYQQDRRKAGASAEDRALFDARDAVGRDPEALNLVDKTAMRLANEELFAMRAERLPRAS
jgi:hypothetical protein